MTPLSLEAARGSCEVPYANSKKDTSWKSSRTNQNSFVPGLSSHRPMWMKEIVSRAVPSVSDPLALGWQPESA